MITDILKTGYKVLPIACMTYLSFSTSSSATLVSWVVSAFSFWQEAPFHASASASQLELLFQTVPLDTPAHYFGLSLIKVSVKRHSSQISIMLVYLT